jgi:hypothetical protein
MGHPGDAAPRAHIGHATEATLDHELALIDDAIRLVAGGGSRRVIVSGLRFAEQLLPHAEVSAATWGVTVRPLWTTDESGADVVVEATP